MITEQAKQMAEFFASLAERTSKPDLDLATIRDITEELHVCGTEPEGAFMGRYLKTGGQKAKKETNLLR